MEIIIRIELIEDIDLIEDIEEREEAQKIYEDEIEKVYNYLKAEEEICEKFNQKLEVEQIDDYRFTLKIISPYKDRAKITKEIIQNIDSILEKSDICFATVEEPEESII